MIMHQSSVICHIKCMLMNRHRSAHQYSAISQHTIGTNQIHPIRTFSIRFKRLKMKSDHRILRWRVHIGRMSFYGDSSTSMKENAFLKFQLWPQYVREHVALLLSHPPPPSTILRLNINNNCSIFPGSWREP